MTHTEMQQMLVRYLMEEHYSVVHEFTLPNRKRADIYAVKSGTILIVEIKTIFRSSLMAEAFGKYRYYCTHLVYATPPAPLVVNGKRSPIVWSDNHLDRIGLWCVDWSGVREQRRPQRLT